MKALCYDKYGGPEVLQIRDEPRPTPGHGEALIRVQATGVLPFDWRFMRAKPVAVRFLAGLFRPRRPILGLEFAGEVHEVGPGLTRLQVGDAVMGLAPQAMAEFVCVRERSVVPKPAGLPFSHAAVVAGSALTALQCVRDHGGLESGQRVLINGASGGVGTFAVQIAKTFGGHVTGVCSGRNVELVKSIGADLVVDYELEDFTAQDEHYDLVIDAVGNRSLTELKRTLTRTGTLVAAAGTVPRLAWLALPRRRRMVSMIGRPNQQDLAVLAGLIADGQLSPVMDRTYPLARAAEAIAYLETGRARGKVAVLIGNDSGQPSHDR